MNEFREIALLRAKLEALIVGASGGDAEARRKLVAARAHPTIAQLVDHIVAGMEKATIGIPPAPWTENPSESGEISANKINASDTPVSGVQKPKCYSYR